MSTLSLFPDLLVFGLLAPFILRVTAGLIFINLGYLKIKGEKKRWEMIFEFLRLKPASLFVNIIGLVEIIGGILLIIGLYTQAAALVFSIVLLLEIFVEYKEDTILKRSIVFYLLLLAISLSLLFSGPGFLAFDLPL